MTQLRMSYKIGALIVNTPVQVSQSTIALCIWMAKVFPIIDAMPCHDVQNSSFHSDWTSIKPGSQYDARLSFCFVSIFRHFVSFRRAVHNVASLCAFLNFDPRYSGRTVGQKRLAYADADEARKP